MIQFLYNPTARQTVFHQTFAKHKLYGGSAGGGKTDGLLGELLMNCIKYPGIKQLFIKRTFPEITEILDERLDKFISSDQGYGYQWIRAKNCIKFAWGEILLWYRQWNKGTDKYFSMEYDVIAIDEITRTIFTYAEFEKLCSRNRSSKANIKALWFEPYVMCATNPWGNGHGYIKQLFIDHDIPEGFKQEHFQFIPAKLSDNPHLMENDPFYKIRLEAISDNDLKRALLNGDRDIFEGKFWTEFYTEKHVVDAFFYVGWVKRSVLCLDYGYTSPSAIYKVSLDNDKNTYISKELYVTKLDYYALGRKIKEIYSGDEIECIVADPAIFTKSGNTESGAEIIQKTSGFKVVMWNNSRIPWRSKMRELFATDNIKIHSTCKDLIQELKGAIHDGKKDGDMDTKKADHGCDSVRYWLVYLHWYGFTMKELATVNNSFIKKWPNVLNTQF